MLSLPPSIRIHLARGATDMRKAIDGLAAITNDVLRLDPMSGHLFVFCNRARNRIKIIYWEESGFWLLHKRLERGRFAWPDGPEPVIRLDAAQLHALLGGLDFTKGRRRRWYRREICKPVKPPSNPRT